jgi:hypothetical protein
MTTEPSRNWFLDLAKSSYDVLLHEETVIRAKLAYAREQRHLVDEQTYTLRLLDLERAIAIKNRRATEVLDAQVLSEEHRDRIVTIADEAFGIGPVEPLDATLSRIERGIFEQHKRLANLETQREADLREAWISGAAWMAAAVEPRNADGAASTSEGRLYVALPSEDRAMRTAAEYARSKVGG